jgi:hypothetical protein
MALKPLVFALAAVMAMAAQAGGNDHGNNGGHGHNHPPKALPWKNCCKSAQVPVLQYSTQNNATTPS